jgi:membrane protease YdiL (CAAX protease family)
VLWKKAWRPEMVLSLAGGIIMSFFLCSMVIETLRRLGVAGFHSVYDAGPVLLTTMSIHGAAIVAGILFLKFHDISWWEVSGLETARWQRQLLLMTVALGAAVPVMLGLKYVSECFMRKVGWPVEDQRAVELILNAKSAGLKIYLGFFAVVLAPLAEEFIFRGMLFSGAKKLGWPKSGWIGASLLFALVHGSAPIFLPLFAFGLALTWLYEKTEGLLAPFAAHSLFNAANLIILLVQT